MRFQNGFFDAANTMFRAGFVNGQFGLPKHFKHTTTEERQTWNSEKTWASKCLTVFGEQCSTIRIATDKSGNIIYTANNAKQFVALDKHDVHDAGRNAYLAFRLWLLDVEFEDEGESRESAGCVVF